MGLVRRAGLAAAIAAAPLGLAYRFALAYRARAGYPRRHPPPMTPADLGLPFEATTVPLRRCSTCRPGSSRPAAGSPAPASSSSTAGSRPATGRCRIALFLHAAGFHCLTIDVRGHGANPPEELPISAGEFGLDALAAFQALVARPEVTRRRDRSATRWARSGRSSPAAADPRVAAVVATSAPADPYRLTRQTFRLARLPIPDPIAYPLAWLTTRVYLRPRGHVVAEHQRDRGHRALPRPDPAGPRRRRRRSCRSATWPACAAARSTARAGDADAAPGRDAS